jgi:glycosyltransferase involved in cell wall biosynthesis
LTTVNIGKPSPDRLQKSSYHRPQGKNDASAGSSWLVQGLEMWAGGRIGIMSGPSTGHGLDTIVARPSGTPPGTWSTPQLDPAVIGARWQISAPEHPTRKILFANKFFFLNGGSEAVMFDEMELMKKSGLDVVEFSMHDERNVPSKYDSYFVSQKGYRSNSLTGQIKSALSFIHSREAVKQITRLIRDEKPDLLHCHNIYHQLTPSIIGAAARLKVPVVLTLHDYKPVCPVYTQLANGQPCTKCSDGRFGALLSQRCANGSIGRSGLLWAEARYQAAAKSYQRVDKFIAPSRFMRDAVVRRYGEDKVVHIPNGIDSSLIEVSGQDKGFVLYLGRLSPEKGVETLLQAHAADNAAWRLVVAGTGPQSQDFKSRFPLAEFTGHLTGDALKARLRDASVVVVPSEWHENSPLSILEAMAHAKPIVAARIGGIPELVRDGETGFLFSPKNTQELSRCIKVLLGDSDLRRKFGGEARRIVETQHSLARHGASLRSLYESLIVASKSSSKIGP